MAGTVPGAPPSPASETVSKLIHIFGAHETEAGPPHSHLRGTPDRETEHTPITTLQLSVSHLTLL